MSSKDDKKKASSTPRKPYQAPAIEETSEFETLALACGKDNYGCTYYGGVSLS